ncbi:unnamed protein product, partial [Brassica oleracea var. botrytis]
QLPSGQEIAVNEMVANSVGGYGQFLDEIIFLRRLSTRI